MRYMKLILIIFFPIGKNNCVHCAHMHECTHICRLHTPLRSEVYYDVLLMRLTYSRPSKTTSNELVTQSLGLLTISEKQIICYHM